MLEIPIGLAVSVGLVVLFLLVVMGFVIWFQYQIAGNLRERNRLLNQIREHDQNIEDLQQEQIDNLEAIIQSLVDFLDVLFHELEWNDASYLKSSCWRLARKHERKEDEYKTGKLCTCGPGGAVEFGGPHDVDCPHRSLNN